MHRTTEAPPAGSIKAMHVSRMLMLGIAVLLFGCVTINIYFPEAEAQQAADRIIDEVRGAATDENAGASVAPAPENAMLANAMRTALNLLVPVAHAQANFDASSPATRALEASLKSRFPGIKPHLDSGAVGLTAEGLLDLRDRNAVPLKDRNTVRQLIADQNADWEALYKEIARVNGHPEWVGQIREVFAERWIAKANRGWYYRDAGGSWKQK